MEALAAAAAIVEREAPDARCAFLGAGALGPRRTATSDLDLVVVTGPRSPLRKVFRAFGWPVELWLQDEEGLRGYWTRDVRARHPALLRVVAEGTALVDGASASSLQDEARRLLAAGPAPLSDAESARRRFLLGDLVDDLATCSPEERPYVANAVLTAAAELALLHAGRWLGGDKWLARELTAYDTALAERLRIAHAAAISGDPDDLLAVADEVLTAAGGRPA